VQGLNTCKKLQKADGYQAKPVQTHRFGVNRNATLDHSNRTMVSFRPKLRMKDDEQWSK